MSEQRKVFTIARLCTACRTCEIACAVAHSKSKMLYGAITEIPLSRYRVEVQYGGGVSLPLNCRQCEEPDCLFACKAGAVSKDPDNGQVDVDLDKCVGCWMCVMVCPFGAVIPDADQGKALKCDLCAGLSEGPACVSACPTGALIFGTIEEVDAFIKQLKKQNISIKSA